MVKTAAAKGIYTVRQHSLFKGGGFVFFSALFNTASSAAPQILLIRRMLGLNSGLLRPVRRSNHSTRSHPHSARSLVHIRLDLILSNMCTLSLQEVVSCFPERNACLCWSFLKNNPGHRGFFLSGKFIHFYRRESLQQNVSRSTFISSNHNSRTSYLKIALAL
jgi:hypothetical protein